MKHRNTRTVKIKSPKSINHVLLKSFLLITTLLILLVEVICFFIVGVTAEKRARDRLTHVALEISAISGGNSDEAISDYLRSYRSEGISAYIVSEDGEIILPFNTEESRISGIEVIKDRLEGKQDRPVIYVENNYINCVKTVSYGGGSYFVANYSHVIIKDSMSKLVVYFVIVGLIVVMLSAIISYSISQRLSSGIKNLSTTAVRFSNGDFNVNFAHAEYQELADLSKTLNAVRDEVKKSGDFQREILANVSHDLKTPLTMIKAYASMIREISGNNPEKREKHLQIIIDEADRLTGLVNDVLNVSKVTSHLDELNPKVFNLTEFLYGIINKFEYLQETQGYSFMVDIDANLYTRADEEKIGQVIYNLLGNAVNYTGEDKTVYISLKKSLNGDRIKFSVKDTGKGIAKEDLSEIWDRYYRVKENHARPVKGTGLGLNIVKIILKNHSFDFGVESELNKGSLFWVDFPCVPEEIEKTDNKQ